MILTLCHLSAVGGDAQVLVRRLWVHLLVGAGAVEALARGRLTAGVRRAHVRRQRRGHVGAAAQVALY